MCVTAAAECVCHYMSDVCSQPSTVRSGSKALSTAGPPPSAVCWSGAERRRCRRVGRLSSWTELEGASLRGTDRHSCLKPGLSWVQSLSVDPCFPLCSGAAQWQTCWREYWSHLVQEHEEELDGAAGEEDAWSSPGAGWVNNVRGWTCRCETWPELKTRTRCTSYSLFLCIMGGMPSHSILVRRDKITARHMKNFTLTHTHIHSLTVTHSSHIFVYRPE